MRFDGPVRTTARTPRRVAAALLWLAASAFSPLAGAQPAADVAVSFFRAVNIDNSRSVRELLAAGFDPNTADPRGQRPLYLALRDESVQVAALLLAHPALNVDATNEANETPLMMAALKGQLDWAQRLIERGAAVNRSGWTPLHYAASGPEPRMLALLLERGASIEAPSPNRTTALMMAARYGDERAVELLLARGADPRARNDLGLNAADFAQRGGRESLAERLKKAAER
jgi:uncharacterized protein